MTDPLLRAWEVLKVWQRPFGMYPPNGQCSCCLTRAIAYDRLCRAAEKVPLRLGYSLALRPQGYVWEMWNYDIADELVHHEDRLTAAVLAVEALRGATP